MKLKRHLTGTEIYCAIAEWLIRRGQKPDISKPSMEMALDRSTDDFDRRMYGVIEVEACQPQDACLNPTPRADLPKSK